MTTDSTSTEDSTVQERLIDQHGDEYKASKEASEEFMKSVPTDEYGLRMMNGDPDPIPRFHSGSIRVDEVLGGGIPIGRIVEVYGPESSGKCLTSDTHMWTDQGLQTVEEIFGRVGQKASIATRKTDVSEQDIAAVNEFGDREPVTMLTHNNRRKVYEITLSSGRSVRVTHRHPLRVINERGFIVWKNAGDIEKGDTVISALFGAESNRSSTSDLTKDEAELIGYLVADGTLKPETKVCYTKGYDDAQARYIELVESILGGEVIVYDGKDCHLNDKKVRTLLADKYGLEYVNAAGKKVPRIVREAAPEVQKRFLAAYFDGDGHIAQDGSMEAMTASEQLAEELQLLLYGFGITCTRSPKQVEGYDQTYHRIYIGPRAADRFIDQIGVLSTRRQAQVASRKESSRSPVMENIPNLSFLVRMLRDTIGGDREFDRIAGKLFHSDRDEQACSKRRLREIIDWTERQYTTPQTEVILDHLKFLEKMPYTYEEVVSIEEEEKVPTFDVVVPETHSFLANGVLSHNTTLTSHMMAETQKRGRGAMMIDVEHSYDPEYAEKIGVNMDALALAQPDSGEQALNLCEKAIRSGHYGLVVVDSVSALTPEAELEGDMGDDSIGLQARMMSQAMRKIRGATQPNNCTVAFTNQIRTNVGQRFGNPETTSGGRALRFYASVRLDLRYTGKVKDGDEVIGNTIRAYCKKNKTAPPFRKAKTMISYNVGINRNKEILDIAIDAGVIKKAGSWYKLMREGEEHARYWEGVQAGLDPDSEDFEEDIQDIPIDEDDMEKTIAQGEAAMLEALNNDPALYEEVMNRALEWWRNN